MSSLFIILALGLILTIPIANSIGIASIVSLWEIGLPVELVAQRFFASINSYPLLAIPFFILAGVIMEKGGISQRIIKFANTCLGASYGGLGVVTVVACMFFAAVSGSGSATTAAIGAIMIPAMINKGYDKNFAAVTTASAAVLGPIIPPSIVSVLYCVGAGVSISSVFMASVIPGILLGTTMIILVKVVSKKQGYVGDRKYSWHERWVAFKEAIVALLTPLVILGGIYSGIFTATEAAVVACIYATIVGFFVYKEIKLVELSSIFIEASKITATIMFTISISGLFAYMLTVYKVPQAIAETFISIGGGKFIFLIFVTILLFIAGALMDGAVIMIILTPILAPVAVSLGINLIHFGVIMVVNSALGQITPPFGLNLFVAMQVANIKMEDMFKYLILFISVIFATITIIIFVPQVSLLIPNLLAK